MTLSVELSVEAKRLIGAGASATSRDLRPPPGGWRQIMDRLEARLTVTTYNVTRTANLLASG